MTTVWKFPVLMDSEFVLQIPEGAELLAVQVQGAEPMLWARVNPDARRVARRFAVHGTGQTIPNNRDKYLGSFQLLLGALAFHVFEVA